MNRNAALSIVNAFAQAVCSDYHYRLLSANDKLHKENREAVEEIGYTIVEFLTNEQKK